MVGVTSLIVISIIVFTITLSSMNFLNADSYQKRAKRRVDITLLQYELENDVIREVYQMKEFFYDNNSEKTVEEFNLKQIENNEVVGMLSKGDYVMVYKVRIDENLELIDYYLINDDDQNYREVEFYD
jgi:uncharacterized radical SAM superfamily protein